MTETMSTISSRICIVLRTVALILWIVSFLALLFWALVNIDSNDPFLPMLLQIAIAVGVGAASKAFLKATDVRVTKTQRVNDPNFRLQLHSVLFSVGAIVIGTIGPAILVHDGSSVGQAIFMTVFRFLCLIPLTSSWSILQRAYNRDWRSGAIRGS